MERRYCYGSTERSIKADWRKRGQKEKNLCAKINDHPAGHENVWFETGGSLQSRKKGFFVRNYSSTQVCVDPSKFNTAICYRIAGKVFKSNLSRDPVARSIRDDLIQEAVKSMWEKSGLLKESKKYNINYQYYFVARNYMNSYLTKWKREMEYNRIIEDLVDAIKINGKRLYHPMFGWVHC